MASLRIAPIALAATRSTRSILSRSSLLSRQCPNSRTALQPTRKPLASQPLRFFSAKTTADEKIEELQELYATARDEFEIAAEETEKMTVYAEDDRKAAREELTKLQEVYRGVVEGPDKETGEEVKRRIGQRVRELENAVTAMEEMAMSQD